MNAGGGPKRSGLLCYLFSMIYRRFPRCRQGVAVARFHRIGGFQPLAKNSWCPAPRVRLLDWLHRFTPCYLGSIIASGMCGGAQMDERRRNWSLWAGFLFCLAALVSYFLIFDKFAATRDVPWVTFLIFGIGAAFLLVGLKRAFGTPERYKGKIAGPVLSVLSLALVGLFCFFVFYLTRQLPASSGAPRVGQRAPEFVLTDTSDQPVSLASLLSAPMANSGKPPRGVVLIFYRGYW